MQHKACKFVLVAATTTKAAAVAFAKGFALRASFCRAAATFAKGHNFVKACYSNYCLAEVGRSQPGHLIHWLMTARCSQPIS